MERLYSTCTCTCTLLFVVIFRHDHRIASDSIVVLLLYDRSAKTTNTNQVMEREPRTEMIATTINDNYKQQTMSNNNKRQGQRRWRRDGMASEMTQSLLLLRYRFGKRAQTASKQRRRDETIISTVVYTKL